MIWNYAVEYAATFIETILIFNVVRYFSNELRCKFNITATIFFTAFISAGVLFLNVNGKLFDYSTTIFAGVLIALFSLILYRVNVFTPAAIILFYYTVSGLNGFILMYAIELIVGVENYIHLSLNTFGEERVFLLLPAKTLEFIYFFIFTRFKKKYNRSVSVLYKIGTALFGLVSITAMVKLTDFASKNENADFKMLILLIWVLIFLFAVGYLIISEIANRAKIRQLQEEAEHKVRHDDKHKNITLYKYVKEKEYEAAEKLVDNILKSNSNITYSLNGDLNHVLQVKIAEAEKENIHINKISVEYPVKTKIKGLDLSALIGNLFDNAIEACKKMSSGEQYINLYIDVFGSLVTIIMENSFYGYLSAKKRKLSTTKENKRLHGHGIKNMKMIARKYHGEYEGEPEGEVFKSTVTLRYK